MRAKTRLAVILLIVAIAPGIASAGGNPHEDIPLGSWIYDAVHALSSQGHFENLLLHTRPYTRGEVSDGVEALRDQRNILSVGEMSLLTRLESEFAEELDGAAMLDEHRVRLGGGPTARIDQFDDGYSLNRIGLDAFAAVSAGSAVTARMRVRIDSDGRQDSQFHGEYWKENFTAWADQAVVTLRQGRFTIAFGREFWRWGPSPYDALLISDNSPPFDGLRLVYRGGNWSFSYHATMLDRMFLGEPGTANRYLVAHRVDWRPHRNFELALSEVMVFGGVDRPWEWNYLNPVLPYYWEQLNTDTDDNPLWNLEFSWRPHPGWQVYGEWMIDDFQIDFVSEPQQIAGLIGLIWWPRALDGRLMLAAEHERINTFVYGQDRPWNRFFHYANVRGDVIGIGSELGTDADRTILQPTLVLSEHVDLTVLIEVVRQGENRIDTDQEKAVPKNLDFPSGDEETTVTVGLGARRQLGGSVVVDVLAGFQGREQDRRVSEGPFVQIRLAALAWKTLGF